MTLATGLRRVVLKPLYLLYRVLPVPVRVAVSLKTSHRFAVGLIAFVFHDSKLLLVKHVYQDGWSLPGGWLKARESIGECVRRELREELGLEVHLTRVIAAETAPHHSVVDVAVRCEALGDQILPDGLEVETAAFFDLDRLPSNILGGQRALLEDFLATDRSVKAARPESLR